MSTIYITMHIVKFSEKCGHFYMCIVFCFGYKKKSRRSWSTELEGDSTGLRQVERFGDGGKSSWRVIKGGRRRKRYKKKKNKNLIVLKN